MIKGRAFASLLTLLWTIASVTAAEDTRYYSIQSADKLIGYAVLSSAAMTHEGSAAIRYSNKTCLKVSVMGATRDVVLDSETVIDAETGQPISYRSTNKSNSVTDIVESKFSGRSVSTWSYREGDERGEPVRTDLPESKICLLASNNFYHWQLILQQAAKSHDTSRATVNAYLPEAQQLEEFTFRRGAEREATVAGKLTRCRVWQSAAPEAELWVDAENGDLLRFEVSKNETVVELSDKQVVDRVANGQAEEVLASHFIQSNVTFDDFLKVTKLVADVDVQVIGSGVGNERSVLNTDMQAFTGDKSGERITGEMRIASVAYDPSAAPEFPSPEQDDSLLPYLKPSAHIESDYEPIAVKSEELVKGAKNRWQAVLQVGQWVHKEIAYKIADSPSARLALETRTGDCGPHSTLMIALLRAAGIPARLVGGVVYTPSLGGSFGQHAWVEVYLGDGRWVSVDPTTGEFEKMSATHIKFFEGMGGVKPQRIHVVDYQPKDSTRFYLPPGKGIPLAWDFGTEYQFKYVKGSETLGYESLQITEEQPDGEVSWKIASQVKLKLNMLSSLSSKTELVTADNARPISFERDFAVLLKKTKVACTFEGQKVDVEISGSQSLQRELDLPAGIFCFDNNLMASWVVICSQLPLKVDEPITIRTFHPSTLQIIPITFLARKLTRIEIGGKEIECLETDVSPIKNTFWISRDRRFLRVTQGDLVIELQ